MLDIRDATVYYPSGVQGVDNLNLHVDDGEFCFITGASGSGKSTLSKLITGELLPDVGTVRVNGYNMSALDIRPWPKRGAPSGWSSRTSALLPA